MTILPEVLSTIETADKAAHVRLSIYIGHRLTHTKRSIEAIKSIFRASSE